MACPQTGRSRRGGGIAVVVALATLLTVMTAAAPATAARATVKSGDTQLTIPRAQVTALTAVSVALLNLSPVSFRFHWDNGVEWWFDAPLAKGGTFDFAARKGTLYHQGGLRFVNVATDQTLRLGGLRFVASGPSSFAFTAAVGDAPSTRAAILVASNPPRFTRQGKTIRIDGVQFRFTDAGALAVALALRVNVSTSALFADTDLQFTLK